MGLFDRFKKDKGDKQRAERDDDDRDERDDDEEAEALYQQVPISAASLTTESQLIYANHQNAEVMPSFTAELLKRCVEFESLEDQATILCRDLRLGADQHAAVVEQLEDLVERGLLIEHDDVIERIQGNAPESPAGTFSTLGIITADRPESLARCVGSFLAAIGDRQIDVVVVDDSDDAANREANLEALKRLAAGTEATIRYADPEARAAFAAAIAEELGGHGDVVELALMGGHQIANTVGGAHNALMLRGAGELIFTADDDVACRVAPVPESEPGLAFSSTPDPTRIIVHEDRASARSSVELEGKDLLAEHERVIGRSTAALVAEADIDDIDLTGAGPRFLDRTSRGLGSVRVSSTGVAGDSGMGGPSYFLRLSGRPAEEVQSDNDSYRNAVESHALVRGALTTTISSGTLLMTMAAGFDNRRPLPPFFPVLRNQDGLFAQTMRVCEPSAAVAHLPWVIDHDPPEERSHELDDAWRGIPRTRANDVVSMFVRSLMLEADYGDTETRMATLGRHLRWLGSLSGAELLETVRRYQWAQVGAQMSLFEHRLDNEDRMPPLLVEHLGRALDHCIEELAKPSFGVPEDLRPSRTDEAAVEVFGQLLSGFGRMLEIWPQVWAAAKAVRAKGVDLGEVVA